MGRMSPAGTAPSTELAPDLAPDACYLALRSRDARFDGRFFTGVTSTGIYCRPVCAVRTPRRENCLFFRHAAQAERAGFRPCLRCRPELAPMGMALPWSAQDAGSILAMQAAQLIDEPQAWDGGAGAGEGGLMARVAARLGVSDRHLRRLFEAQLGVSPLQYLQTRRPAWRSARRCWRRPAWTWRAPASPRRSTASSSSARWSVARRWRPACRRPSCS